MRYELFTNPTKKQASINITFITFISAIFILWGCNQSATSGNKEEQASKTGTAVPAAARTAKTIPAELFTLKEAERILGEPAHLSSSSSNFSNDTFQYNRAYKADSTEMKSGKTGTVYFMVEDYANADAASKSYLNIKTMNEKNGIETLHGMGDEAYYHSDGENFYFILVRKGTKMFRIKVNKITSKTNKDEFMKVSKEITAKL